MQCQGLTENPIIWKPVHRFAQQINGLISIDRDLLHGRVKGGKWIVVSYCHSTLKIFDVVLLSLLLLKNKFHTLLWCFHCWIWTSKCWLGVCNFRTLVRNSLKWVDNNPSKHTTYFKRALASAKRQIKRITYIQFRSCVYSKDF